MARGNNQYTKSSSVRLARAMKERQDRLAGKVAGKAGSVALSRATKGGGMGGLLGGIGGSILGPIIGAALTPLTAGIINPVTMKIAMAGLTKALPALIAAGGTYAGTKVGAGDRLFGKAGEKATKEFEEMTGQKYVDAIGGSEELGSQFASKIGGMNQQALMSGLLSGAVSATGATDLLKNAGMSGLKKVGIDLTSVAKLNKLNAVKKAAENINIDDLSEPLKRIAVTEGKESVAKLMQLPKNVQDALTNVHGSDPRLYNRNLDIMTGAYDWSLADLRNIFKGGVPLEGTAEDARLANMIKLQEAGLVEPNVMVTPPLKTYNVNLGIPPRGRLKRPSINTTPITGPSNLHNQSAPAANPPNVSPVFQPGVNQGSTSSLYDPGAQSTTSGIADPSLGVPSNTTMASAANNVLKTINEILGSGSNTIAEATNELTYGDLIDEASAMDEPWKIDEMFKSNVANNPFDRAKNRSV